MGQLYHIFHDNSDYKDWLVELKERFYSHRLKASCATNGYLLDFYWKLGRDIEAKQYTNTYGSGFYKNLSQDLKNEMPGVKGFSPINLRYMSKFFKLYAPLYRNIPQTAELFSDSLSDSNVPQVAEQSKKRQQPVDDFKMLFSTFRGQSSGRVSPNPGQSLMMLGSADIDASIATILSPSNSEGMNI